MTDFDDRLRERLVILDAAVPRPAEPSVQPIAMKRLRRRSRVLMVLAATTVLAVGTALAVTGKTPPLTAEQEAANEVLEEMVRDDMGAAFGGRCLNEAQARALVQARFDALGLSGWTMRVAGFPFGITEAPCVGGGVSAATKEFLLLPSMGGEVASSLDVLADELLAGCYGWEEATAMLRSTLEDAGMSNPVIVRSGVRGVPSSDSDTYLEKYADGCVLSAGAQSGITGRYTWYLAGK